MSSSTAAAPGQGGIRWRRFAAILIPAIVVAAVLVVLTAESGLAVSFSISGTPFTVTARQLRGQGFEQFIVGDSVVKGSTGDNDPPLTASAIRSASISDLCQSVSIGPFSLVITAGGGSSPVTATDLVVDADRLSGSVASFTHIRIGQDASTLNQVPGITGPPGGFAQQASTIVIDHLRQHAFATTAGTFTLPGFSLSFGGHC